MMTIGAILIATIGFYLLYSTSLRADKRTDFVSVWLQKNRMVSKWAGVVTLVVSFVILSIAEGLGTGLLFGFTVLMTAGSLIVLLSPLINRR